MENYQKLVANRTKRVFRRGALCGWIGTFLLIAGGLVALGLQKWAVMLALWGGAGLVFVAAVISAWIANKLVDQCVQELIEDGEL